MKNTLRASIFKIPEPNGRGMTARALWAAMAHDLSEEFPESYGFEKGMGFSIRINSDVDCSVDSEIVRYRTIQASIRRRSGHSTLLDLSVGNQFALATARPPRAIHIDPAYAEWGRSVGRISLSEHIKLIHQFAADLLCACWMIEPEELTAIHLPAPGIVTARGKDLLPVSKVSSLTRTPLSMPPSGSVISVVSEKRSIADAASSQLREAFKRFLPNPKEGLPKIMPTNGITGSSTNLILLEDTLDLNKDPILRDQLRAAEAAGVRFKLSKMSSLAKPYPSMNIAFDLFHLAGGQLWRAAGPNTPFCSLDAGHDRESRKSRWVKVESDHMQRITSVAVCDTPLAEHLPENLIDRFWPRHPDAVFCRDGRFSQERHAIESRAASESRALLEIKKSPTSILWRGNGDEAKTAIFGDAVVDSHGEVLLQTVMQNFKDYISPVRLTVHGGDRNQLVTDFLHEQAMPGLSLFNLSRLPGTLYFADLISKLTAVGWPKAIGRGFNIPIIIPPS